jgi:hypothetical protein
MKQDFLKRKIEEMRKTRLSESGEFIGDAAKEHLVNVWAKTTAEALVNTVLAIRQRWKETVEPRLNDFRKNYSQIRTIYDLKELMSSMSESEFCERVFGMKIRETPNRRYEILGNMTAAFVQYQKDNGFASDGEAMKDWAQKCDPAKLEQDIIGKIPNVNIATVQNLRICLGIDTLKPDVHVRNAMREIGLGNDVEVAELISELTGYSPRELDQIFWHWDREISKKKQPT